MVRALSSTVLGSSTFFELPQIETSARDRESSKVELLEEKLEKKKKAG